MAPIYSIETSVEKAESLRKLGFDLKEDFQIADLNRSDWIVVPKKKENEFIKDSYAFDINPARLSCNSAVEKVGKELGINYKNTSNDSLGREFVGNNNWSQFLMLNQFLGVQTPSLEQKVDYLHLLYLGSQGKIKVYNASGKQIDSEICEKYLMDIIGVRSPWRAEWIDADFKVKNKRLCINSEPLDKNTLMEDRQISLEDYINNNHTSQGLPSKKVKSGDLYYLYPRSDNNSVAGFYAGSGKAGLDCCRGPSNWDSSLGVRAVRHE